MTKAHQFERVNFVFCFRNILVDFLDIAYFIQHVEYRLVGSSMGWPPQRGNPGRYSRIWIAFG